MPSPFRALVNACRKATPSGPASKSGHAYLEVINHQFAQGWIGGAAEPPRTIEVLQDGRPLATAKADIPRPDITAVPDASGFFLEFPSPVDPAALTIRVAETSAPLCPLPKAMRPSQRNRMEGMCEHLSETLTLSGWAWEKDDPETPCQISVLLDGVPVASGQAALFRPDLQAAGKGRGRCAFRLRIPPGAITRPRQVLRVLANGQPLLGAPRWLDLTKLASIAIEGVVDGQLALSLSQWAGPVEQAVIRVNGENMDEVAWPHHEQTAARQTSWPLPPALCDGQPNVYQVELHAGEAVLRSECATLRAPAYRFGVLGCDFETLHAWVAREDSVAPVRVAVYHDGQCLLPAVDPAPDTWVQREEDLLPEACVLDVVYPAPLRGDSATLTLQDTATGLPVGEVSLFRHHEALLSLAQSVRAVLPADDAAAMIETFLRQRITDASPACQALARPAKRNLSEADAEEVAVIIPVYGGFDATAACLESVLAAKNEMPVTIFLINDCSPDPAINAYIRDLEAKALPYLRTLQLPKNLGFVGAVNLGMAAAGGRDVILLNADTTVQDQWVDRLRRAAGQDKRIATVTPLSNNGEICTVPTICEQTPMPDAALARRVAGMAAASNEGRIADIPVGVGFCLYIRRTCLDAVGPFDEATWGRGYGEETDFCLKAAAAGWRHVLAADCFVGHQGHGSFGEEKLARIKASATIINARYPFYQERIHRFIREDPARALRQQVALGLLDETLPPRRVLHVTHAYKGGTERYLQDVAAIAKADGVFPIVLRFEDGGDATLEIEVEDVTLQGFFKPLHTAWYPRQASADLQHALERLGLASIHLHSPLGVPLPMLTWLTQQYPYAVTVHDYAWACPRLTLTRPEQPADGSRATDQAPCVSGKSVSALRRTAPASRRGTSGLRKSGTASREVPFASRDTALAYCHEPPVARCTVCAGASPVHPGLRHMLADCLGDMQTYRQRFQDILANAETIFAGSEDVRERMERLGYRGHFHIAPHPAPKGSPFLSECPVPAPREDGVVRVAIIGGLSPIKGYATLLACARHAQARSLPLQFILFGYVAQEEELAALPNVCVTGPYEETNLEGLVGIHGPRLAWFPALWPETFSYTLSHAFRLGLWPVVTDIGAPAERVRTKGVGTIYPLDASPEDICELLMQEQHR